MKKYGYRTTTNDVLHGCDLTGKQIVVTGASSGLGAETARALACAGADVLLCCRDVESGKEVARKIEEELGDGKTNKIIVKELNLADLLSVRALVSDLNKSLERLDVLVLNAGVMACPLSVTKDGFEMQLGTNHLGHMALTQGLLDKLKATGTVESPARVISVSSEGHRLGSINLKDLNYSRNRQYNEWSAYGQSKLANILFAKELASRMKAENANVAAFSLHPGVIMTNLQRHMGLMRSVFFFIKYFMKDIPQGAATTVYAATDPEVVKTHNGEYLADCKVYKPSKAGRDVALAKSLWEESDRLIQQAYAERDGNLKMAS